MNRKKSAPIFIKEIKFPESFSTLNINKLENIDDNNNKESENDMNKYQEDWIKNN